MLGTCAAGAHDNLQIGSLGLRLLGQFIPIQSGHLDISDEDFNAFFGFQLFEGVRAACSGHDLAAKIFQYRRRKIEDERLVIDYEKNAGHRKLPRQVRSKDQLPVRSTQLADIMFHLLTRAKRVPAEPAEISIQKMKKASFYEG